MKYRITMWALAGFLLAGFWALFAVATFPSTPERMRDVWTVICITCPVAIVGMHYPISLYAALVANGRVAHASPLTQRWVPHPSLFSKGALA